MLEPTTPARSGDCPGAGVRRLRQRAAARPAGLVLAPLLDLLAPQAVSVRLRRGAAPAPAAARMLNAIITRPLAPTLRRQRFGMGRVYNDVEQRRLDTKCRTSAKSVCFIWPI